jgi:hypothetical protein
MTKGVFGKPGVYSFLGFVFFTVLSVNMTPSFAAAQQCVDIFAPGSNDIRTDGALSEAVEGASPDMQFKTFVEVFDNVPSMRPFASRQMLRIAENNLNKNGVEFTKEITARGGVLIITPSEASQLNKLAQDIYEKYGAVLQINPYLMLQSHEKGMFSTYTEANGLAAPEPALNLSWKDITDIEHIKYWRDTELLGELRHLATFHDLSDRKHYSLYGNIFVVGKIPGDPNPHIAENSRFFYFDKIKIYHTYIKEELTALRGLVNDRASLADIQAQQEKVAGLIDMLNILGARTGGAVGEYLKPGNELISGSTDISDTHVWVKIKYDDKNGNVFTMKIPIVTAMGLYDKKLGYKIDRQLNWLWNTARNAVQQSAAAEKIFSEFSINMTAEELVALIDATQNALPSATLVPAEPE